MDLLEEKIGIIAKEIEEAGASTWTITKIIKELSEMETRSEVKLRETALKSLKKLDAQAAKVYEAFSRMKVFTSKETIENFNRGHIIQSLLKETSISRNVAEKITLEVENEIKDSKISFLTTALIRELVNSKIVLYGFEKIRNEYTRIGFPVYEIKRKLAQNQITGEETKEYNFLNIIPREATKLHFNGTIYIEDVGGFSNRPFAYSFLSETHENIDKTIKENLKKIIRNKKYFSTMPNLHGLAYACSANIEGEKNAKSTAKKINNYIDLIEDDFCNYLELFTPSYLEGLDDKRLISASISNNLIENKNSVFGVDSKYALKLLNVKNKNIKILNNSKEELLPLGKNIFSEKKGINFFVNINLENLSKEEDKFFEELSEIYEVIEKTRIIKKELLLEKDYLKDFHINNMDSGIGITNLFSIGKQITGKERDFANKAIKEINNIFKDYLIFGLGSKKARDKFSGTIGSEVYSHNILNFNDCADSKKACFSGVTKTIKEANELIDKGIKQINYYGKYL